MDDLISRQAAIGALDNWLKIAEYPLNKSEYNNGEIAAYVTAIDAVKSIRAEQRWIPVTKMLPKESEKTYWVCTDSGYQCQCRWTNDMYGLGSTEWSTWGWNVFDKPQYSKVVAWMSLPEPYREEKE